MVGNHPSQQEVAAGDRRGGHKGGGRNPVRDHMMLCSGELFHSFDDDPSFAGAGYPCAAGIQEAA